MKKKILSTISLLQSLSTLTYKSAGVDVEAGNQFVQDIHALVKTTSRKGCDASLKGFSAICDLKKLDYNDPLLLTSTDGVGTKLKLAQATNNHTTIGIDLVAMCVNDLLVHGAEPISFLDYFATGKLDKSTGVEVITGIVEGCKQARCALAGGETAEMPGMYQDGEYDLAGFALGLVERKQLLPQKNAIQNGDVIIGLPSSGLHSNGFSLVRKIIDTYQYQLDDSAPFKTDHHTLAGALLAPTKIYVRSVLPLMKKGLIKAASHITGGGFYDNIPRVLPEHLSATIDARQWRMPSLFAWLCQAHTISPNEMFKTFNMGIGMILIADKDHAQVIKKELEQSGEQAFIIGSVQERMQDPVTINYMNRVHAQENVLVIGSGGREHAIAHAIAESPSVSKVYVAPGNGGTQDEYKCENIKLNLNNHDELINFVKRKKISLTLVGPEQPLADGIVDHFQEHNCAIVGPGKQAAQLETSKSFAKKFMQKHSIPTAGFCVFTDSENAKAYVQNRKQFPLVIKADGLCAGKGVSIAHTIDQAETVIENLLEKKSLGSAADSIIIEDFIKGKELSIFVVTDGKSYKLLPTACDYKKLNKGTDQPMTGGLGAISFEIEAALLKKVTTQVIEPTLNGLNKDGINYKGFLYFGLMMQDGNPYVLEYNCRLGDPETQAILTRLQTDFSFIAYAVAHETLDQLPEFNWHTSPAITLVLAAQGYPKQAKIGDIITGYEQIANVKLFHAGTKKEAGQLTTSAGRVLSITALATSLQEAQILAYNAAQHIHWEGMQYRKDIGKERQFK